jgi:DNA-binding GntR family transcriptional regulator
MPARKKPARAGSKKSSGSRAITSGPLYRQLVEALRHEIVKGLYPIGTQLPTELSLCERFGVSRHTVREALRQLRLDGLISSRRGSGTTVMLPSPTGFNVHRVGSIDDLIAYGASSKYHVERSDLVVADEQLAHELEVPPGKRWLRLEGYRLTEERDESPLSWTVVYVAAEYAGVERLIARKRVSIWSLIEDVYGERLTEVEQRLRVLPVPAEVAKRLRIDSDRHVVEVRRRYITSSDKIAEVAINLYPADTFSFSMKLRRA